MGQVQVLKFRKLCFWFLSLGMLVFQGFESRLSCGSSNSRSEVSNPQTPTYYQPLSWWEPGHGSGGRACAHGTSPHVWAVGECMHAALFARMAAHVPDACANGAAHALAHHLCGTIPLLSLCQATELERLGISVLEYSTSWNVDILSGFRGLGRMSCFFAYLCSSKLNLLYTGEPLRGMKLGIVFIM